MLKNMPLAHLNNVNSVPKHEILAKLYMMELDCTLLQMLLIFPIRLEEKIANLESENQVLRQQAVSMASNKFGSGRQRSILQVYQV